LFVNAIIGSRMEVNIDERSKKEARPPPRLPSVGQGLSPPHADDGGQVKKEDNLARDRISSGIIGLDEVIEGGIRNHTVTIIVGARRDGKRYVHKKQ